ncbi:MAG: RHS repeat-associated core domain-containing protein, partial [Hyphomicrobiales bacterium]
DRAGEITWLGYDNLNRTIAVNAPGSTPDISSAYDNLGRMTVTGNGTITVGTTWDGLSRPVVEGSSVIGGMTYEYDEAGRLTRMKWPDNFAANYAYDLYGAVTSISQQPSGGSATQVAAYGWNDLGQPTSISRAGGAGVSTTRGYDAWGRLSSLSHDATGTSNDVTLGFTYNPAGQIIGRSVSNESYLYGASPTGATAYQVDGQNQLDSINSAAVTHDSRGNVTGVSGSTYGYDDLNRLTSASAGAGASSFTFDPVNRLATSTVGGATVRRQYVGDQLVAEYNPATGGMLKRYIPGLGLDDVAVAYDGSGTSTRNWQLADERGSVIGLSGSTGAVSTINTYDDYGVPASGNVGRFQYTGQQWLPEAGAYHYRARTYLPQVGRFLQTDPIGYAAGMNLYAYVGGDPVNSRDPLGLDEDPVELEGGVVVGRRRQRERCDFFCRFKGAFRGPWDKPTYDFDVSGGPQLVQGPQEDCKIAKYGDRVYLGVPRSRSAIARFSIVSRNSIPSLEGGSVTVATVPHANSVQTAPRTAMTGANIAIDFDNIVTVQVTDASWYDQAPVQTITLAWSPWTEGERELSLSPQGRYTAVIGGNRVFPLQGELENAEVRVCVDW